MRRPTAGALVLTVVNIITKHLIVNSKIIINLTRRLKERTKLQPKIKIKRRKRRVKKQPLTMQIPKEKMKENQKRKYLRMTLQGNITLKK